MIDLAGLPPLEDLNITALSGHERRELLALLERKAEWTATTKLFRYQPYRKQRDFHAAGGDMSIRERLLCAGNQLGKSLCASMETAMHLTGLYPSWWEGARFDAAVTGWAASLTSQSTRDTVQRLLLGPPGQWGTGAIPKANIVEIKRASHGVADAVDSVTVAHESGGVSRLGIKTYDQGRERWQGETLDFVWFDEEPRDPALYTEGLTRTNATGGITYMTFTPLMGMSDVVRRFLTDKPAGTHVTSMTIHDAEHYTPEDRARIIATYPAHEREARATGVPTLGSGKVFAVPEEVLRERAVPIPKHWPRIAGIDFGWDHPTAVVWLAWDRDTDTVHVYDAYRVKEATPVTHAAAIKAKGAWIPVAWPHDGLQHDKGSGEQLAAQYKAQGVNMLADRAKFTDGSNGVEAGLSDMLMKMETGRFKVAAHLNDWWEEFRLYHRADGKVVKTGDDLMSATRYAVMSLRKAICQPVGRQDAPIVTFEPFDRATGY